MSNMLKSSFLDSCIAPLADCDTSQIPIGSSCYDFSYTKTLPTSGIVFNSHLYDIEGTQLSSYTGATLQDCASSCSLNSNCKAFTYSLNSTGAPDLWVKGKCTTYGDYTDTKEAPQGPDGQCTSVYIRDNKTNDGTFSIVSSYGNTLTINTNNPKLNAVKPTIQTKHGGVSCREKVSKTVYSGSAYGNLLQDMADFCQDNQDISTCVDFCNHSEYTDYCPWYTGSTENKTTIFILIAVLFLVIFVMIYLVIRAPTKKVKKIEYIIFGIIIVILGAISITKLVKLFTGVQDKKPEYSSSTWMDGTAKQSGCPQDDPSCPANCRVFAGPCVCQGNNMKYGVGYTLVNSEYGKWKCIKNSPTSVGSDDTTQQGFGWFPVDNYNGNLPANVGVYTFYDENGGIPPSNLIKTGDTVTITVNGSWLTKSSYDAIDIVKARDPSIGITKYIMDILTTNQSYERTKLIVNGYKYNDDPDCVGKLDVTTVKSGLILKIGDLFWLQDPSSLYPLCWGPILSDEYTYTYLGFPLPMKYFNCSDKTNYCQWNPQGAVCSGPWVFQANTIQS